METEGPAAKGRAHLDALRAIATRFSERGTNALTTGEETKILETARGVLSAYFFDSDPDWREFEESGRPKGRHIDLGDYETGLQSQIDNFNRMVARMPSLARCIVRIEAVVSQLPERQPTIAEKIADRNRVLRALYDLVDGRTNDLAVSLEEIAKRAGINELMTRGLLRDLYGNIKPHSNHHYSLTPNGRDAVEELEIKNSRTQEREAPIRRLGLEGMHPEILKAASDLFTDGHLQQAVSVAFRTVELRVREMSRLESFGKALMGDAFGSDSPIINVATTGGLSGKNEQEGLKLLFMGAMAGIRNPETHESNSNASDAQSALEHLAFASLLMRRLERAKVAERVPATTAVKTAGP